MFVVSSQMKSELPRFMANHESSWLAVIHEERGKASELELAEAAKYSVNMMEQNANSHM